MREGEPIRTEVVDKLPDPNVGFGRVAVVTKCQQYMTHALLQRGLDELPRGVRGLSVTFRGFGLVWKFVIQIGRHIIDVPTDLN